MYIKIKSLRIKDGSIEAYFPSDINVITIILDSGAELELTCKDVVERDSILKQMDN